MQVCWVSEWAAGVKKSNFLFIYLFSVTFYCTAKEICGHIIGKNTWDSIGYSLGDKSFAQLTRLRCNWWNISQMYMAEISDIRMTWWTIAKTHILSGDCNQGLKHAVKLQKYLAKMIKYTFIYLYIFIQLVPLIHLPNQYNISRVKHTMGSGQAVNIICISMLVISTSFMFGFQHLKLFGF